MERNWVLPSAQEYNQVVMKQLPSFQQTFHRFSVYWLQFGHAAVSGTE